MKFKFVYLFMVLIILLGFTMSCSFEDKNLHKVQFNKVIDGNTIKVIIDEELKDVRLILVDSPELRGTILLELKLRNIYIISYQMLIMFIWN